MPVAGEHDPSSIGGVRIPSRLSVFRVIGLAHGFEERPRARTREVPAGPEVGDRLRVTIGDIPEEFVDAYRARVAWANFMLDAVFGGRHRGLSAVELEDVFAEGIEDRNSALAKLHGDCRTWMTIEVFREVHVIGHPDRTHRWLENPADVIPLMEEFGESAATFIDVAAVRLLPSMRNALKPSRTTYRERSAYLRSARKTAVYVPTFSTGGNVTVTSVWDDEGWAEIDQAVSALGYDRRNVKWLRTPARWLWSALGESTDDLRRFQFAFLGLEVLTHKVGKRLEAAAGLSLADDERGVEARFARVSEFFRGAGKWTDKVTFSRLVAKRNDLAHGRATDGDLKSLPAWDAVWMLRDYLASVAAAEAAATLP